VVARQDIREPDSRIDRVLAHQDPFTLRSPRTALPEVDRAIAVHEHLPHRGIPVLRDNAAGPWNPDRLHQRPFVTNASDYLVSPAGAAGGACPMNGTPSPAQIRAASTSAISVCRGIACRAPFAGFVQSEWREPSRLST